MGEEESKEAGGPVHTVDFGKIRAHIWANESKFGTRLNVTVARYYLENGRWKRSESFGKNELLILAKALVDAHTWIFQHDGLSEEG